MLDTLPNGLRGWAWWWGISFHIKITTSPWGRRSIICLYVSDLNCFGWVIIAVITKRKSWWWNIWHFGSSFHCNQDISSDQYYHVSSCLNGVVLNVSLGTGNCVRCDQGHLCSSCSFHFGCRYLEGVQILGNDDNKSKPDSGGNKDEIELRLYLLPFGAEPFVLSSAV
jgi:hypothetical protein